jgi:hypothetical protein
LLFTLSLGTKVDFTILLRRTFLGAAFNRRRGLESCPSGFEHNPSIMHTLICIIGRQRDAVVPLQR